MLLEEDVYIAIYLSTQSFFQAKKERLGGWWKIVTQEENVWEGVY